LPLLDSSAELPPTLLTCCDDMTNLKEVYVIAEITLWGIYPKIGLYNTGELYSPRNLSSEIRLFQLKCSTPTYALRTNLELLRSAQTSRQQMVSPVRLVLM
jgi:hypothetical protein